MLGIVVSIVAFFLAGFSIKRHLEQIGIPKGMTRNLVIFCLALAVSYGVAAATDWLFS
jgi:hypothetical protein